MGYPPRVDIKSRKRTHYEGKVDYFGPGQDKKNVGKGGGDDYDGEDMMIGFFDIRRKKGGNTARGTMGGMTSPGWWYW